MKLLKRIITIIILPIYLIIKLALTLLFIVVDWSREIGEPIVEGMQIITEKIKDTYKNLYSMLFKERRSGGKEICK